MVVIDNGTQDEVWGQATSLLGQLGPVVILNESLKETQLSALYNAGKTHYCQEKNEWNYLSGSNCFVSMKLCKKMYYYLQSCKHKLIKLIAISTHVFKNLFL